ncbi:hypothetical protein B0O80DRAFT_460462 [Mortierella sp. GBAus27b]|nr:hypothetical protein B0O80DRAFT_460462 [Mortierella sp. GBAus27b]
MQRAFVMSSTLWKRPAISLASGSTGRHCRFSSLPRIGSLQAAQTIRLFSHQSKNADKVKILFFGSDSFSVPHLEALIAEKGNCIDIAFLVRYHLQPSGCPLKAHQISIR